MPTQRRIEATLKEMEEMIANLRAINDEDTSWSEELNRHKNICLEAEVDPDDRW